MPVIIEGGRIPRHLSRKTQLPAPKSANGKKPHKGQIRIALINNMPDAALEDTEAQFFDLLDAASGGHTISLKLYSLPKLPRKEAGKHRLQSFYFGIEDLLNDRFDGMIMTGTEPCQAGLQNEPYWPVLTEVLEWAERETSSTVLSCLAAHAGVLHSDGISRHRLADKQFGVFEYKTIRSHHLTNEAGETIQIPHSRWNEVRADDLSSLGYELLTHSADAGVDLFVKKKGRSLFLHFQGHPEYGMRTLLKEYRRDIKRFLRNERETYPTMPHKYFDAQAVKLLTEFQESAVAKPSATHMEKFPEAEAARGIRGDWHGSAVVVYRNWLAYLAARKAEEAPHTAMSQAARR
jgi:homoserine O-succinyltransferase/O-acetyltransferase